MRKKKKRIRIEENRGDKFNFRNVTETFNRQKTRN